MQKMGSRVKDLTGQRFGSLVVREFAGTHGAPALKAYWLCDCDCGETRTVPGKELASGLRVACKACAKAKRYKKNAVDIPGVYLLSNKCEPFFYIGQTKSLRRRENEHRHKMKHGLVNVNSRITVMCEKHGHESFEFIVLEQCAACDLLAREAYWINRYRELHSDFLVNSLGPNDAPNRGIKQSPEHTAKIAAAAKGRPLSPEHKEKNRENLRKATAVRVSNANKRAESRHAHD